MQMKRKGVCRKEKREREWLREMEREMERV